MRRRSKYHVGRLRVRAAELLAAEFPEWDVRPEDISPASGSWRTDWRNDVYRWELFTRLKTRTTRGDELPVVCGCWDTLTLFVRHCPRVGCQDDDGVIYLGRAPMKIRVTPQDIGYPEITVPGSLVKPLEDAERADSPAGWDALHLACIGHNFPRPLPT